MFIRHLLHFYSELTSQYKRWRCHHNNNKTMKCCLYCLHFLLFLLSVLTGDIKYAPLINVAKNVTKYNNFCVVILHALRNVGAFKRWYSNTIHMINCIAHTNAINMNRPPMPAWYGKLGSSQCSPVYRISQRQVPLWHSPRPEQSSSQLLLRPVIRNKWRNIWTAETKHNCHTQWLKQVTLKQTIICIPKQRQTMEGGRW